MRVRLVLLLATALSVAAVVAPFASAAALPAKTAALGDSLTRGYGAGGAAQDYPNASWATGTDPASSSQYLDLLAAGAPATGGAYNDAVSGSTISATTSQASTAVGQGAQFVTVWSGTNDVCTSSISQMTSVSSFSSSLQQTLTTLTNGLPGVQILVVSIPNWYGFWQKFSGNSTAQSAWASYANRCPDLLSSTATASDRQTFAQRVTDLNSAAASVCAGFAACKYDGGAAYNLWTTLSASDFTFDFFHLSLSGQAKVSAAEWSAGFFSSTSQAVVGYPAVGSQSAGDGPGYLDVSGPWTLTRNASLSQLTGYMRGGAAAGVLRAVVYSDAGGRPGAVVAVSNEVTVTAGKAAGWVQLPLPASVTLNAGSYWLGYWYGDSALSLTFDAGLASERYVAVPYSSTGSPPAQFGTGAVSDSDYSLYATLTSGGGGGGGGGGTAPANTAAPTISGTPTEGQTLTATTGTWSGSPTGYAYQWQDCNSTATTCSAIAGATAATDTLTAADVGDTIRVQVTASNTTGSATAQSAPTATVTSGGGGGTTGTLGNTVVGTDTDHGGAGYLDFSGPYTLAAPEAVTSLAAYVAGGTATSHLRGVIYADTGGNPGSFVAVTPEITIAAGKAAGWVTLAFGSAVSLPAGKYWLGYWYADGSSVHYATSVAGSERYESAPYSSTADPPATLTRLADAGSEYSLYAAYG